MGGQTGWCTCVAGVSAAKRKAHTPRPLQVLFSVTFTFSTHMPVLIILEISGTMTPQARAALWQLDLGGLAALLLGALPLLLFFTLASARGWSWPLAALATAAAQVLYLAAMKRLGTLFPLTTGGEGAAEGLPGIIGRLGVLGVTVAAVLSAYGAVATPYAFVTLSWERVDEGDVARQRAVARKVLDSLAGTQRRLVAAQAAAARGAAAKGAARAGRGAGGPCVAAARLLLGALCWDGVAAARSAGDGGLRVAALAGQAAMLRDIHAHEQRQLVEVLEAQARVRRAQTLEGRAASALGLLLAVYGVYRVVMASVNVLLSRDPTADPITTALALALTYADIPDAQAWVQPASFVLAGVLVLSNVRGFLVNASRVFRQVSGAGGAAPTGLLLAAVMGSYFVATILLMRMSLPEQYRVGLVAAVGAVQFNLFHRWFDVVFVVTALITAMALALFTARWSLFATPLAPSALTQDLPPQPPTWPSPASTTSAAWGGSADSRVSRGSMGRGGGRSTPRVGGRSTKLE